MSPNLGLETTLGRGEALVLAKEAGGGRDWASETPKYPSVMWGNSRGIDLEGDNHLEGGGSGRAEREAISSLESPSPDLESPSYLEREFALANSAAKMAATASPSAAEESLAALRATEAAARAFPEASVAAWMRPVVPGEKDSGVRLFFVPPFPSEDEEGAAWPEAEEEEDEDD